MNTRTLGNDEQLDSLAEEFAERFRRGERPALAEYLERYPHLAEEIRELFPALAEMERAEANIAAPVHAPLLQVGDYRILREVGRGGMGIVYEAEQASLGRRVALKVLSNGIRGRGKSLERFKREARAAARLHHTNIVPVFDVGEDGEVCFYTMQFIQGQGLEKVIEELQHLRSAKNAASPREGDSLAQSLIRGRFSTLSLERTMDLPAAEATGTEAGSATKLPGDNELSSAVTNRDHYFESVARIGRQTASALAHAHQRGVIHRDIKPSNLLLDASGTVWVTDFGLAKTEEEDLTNTGDILGTIRYMAPERFRGRSDARSDIYALGMTLYELLVLRPAFESSDRASLIAKIASEEPVRPRAIDPRIPGDLETIVLKAIAKEAEQRYRTADDLSEDLRCYLDGEPIKARRTGPLGRARLWSRRNPAWAALYAVLFAAALGATATAFNFSVLLRESEANRRDRETAERHAREDLFTSLVAQADASRSSHRVGQRFETLETVKKAMGLARELDLPSERLERLRTVAIAALALPDIRKKEEWLPYGNDFNGAFDADAENRLVAVGLRSGFAVVCRASDHRELTRLKCRADALHMSRDGRFLLVISNNTFSVWDIAGPEPRVVIGWTESRGVLLHPDSHRIVIVRHQHAFELVDLLSQKPERVWHPQSTQGIKPISFDASGRYLLAIVDSKACVFDVTVPPSSYQQLHHDGGCENACWHPNGRWVALVNPGRIIQLWDIKKNCPLGYPMAGSVNSGIEMAFTPDGEQLLSWGWEGNLRVWQYRTGRQVLQFAGAGAVHFDKDGGCLIGSGQRLVRAEIVSSREYRTFGTAGRFGANFDFWNGAIHPNGRLLAVPSNSGLHFWDLDIGEEVLSVPNRPSYAIRFPSNDECLIYSLQALETLRVSRTGADASCYRIGPAKPINSGSFGSFLCSADGKTLAQAMYPKKGVCVFARDHLAGEWTPCPFEIPFFVNSVAVSPEGSLLATGSFRENTKSFIWSTKSGRKLAEYDTIGATTIAFSPNNKWLAIRSNVLSLLIPVGDWQNGKPLEGGFGRLGFSPDSDLLAVETGAGIIQCYKIETVHKCVRLEEPNQEIAGWLAFTPDGTRLVASSNDSKSIHVWDLRLIRQELAELGLDWDAPPFPAAKVAEQPKTSLRVEIEPQPKK